MNSNQSQRQSQQQQSGQGNDPSQGQQQSGGVFDPNVSDEGGEYRSPDRGDSNRAPRQQQPGRAPHQQQGDALGGGVRQGSLDEDIEDDAGDTRPNADTGPGSPSRS